MEISSVFGLPAHPFMVHRPVVLIPLAALVAVAAVVFSRARYPLSLTAAGLSVVGAVSAILAAGSGEALEDSLGESNPLVDTHAELGEGLRNFAIVFMVAAVAFAVHVHLTRRANEGRGGYLRSRGMLIGTAAAMLITAGLSTVWTVRAGHSGAKAVWHEEWNQRGQGDGEGPGERDEGRTTVPPATGTAAAGDRS